MNLPRKGEIVTLTGPHGETATLKRSGRDWVILYPGRTRWGNKAETLEDVERFQTYGHLPPAKPGWFL